MAYFQNFPVITYMGNEISDITFRIAMYEKLTANVSAFEPYRVKNGDRIEDIAHKVYGNSELHWIIVMANQITDPFYDWPLNDIELSEYIDAKYIDRNDTHHYVDSTTGRIVPVTWPTAIPITNYEYENNENEKFREIKMISPKYVAAILSEFETILGE